MYCLVSLPRAGSIATYSWILQALGKKYPEYQEIVDLLFVEAKHPHVFKNVAELFEEINVYNPLYENVHRKYNDLEQTLMPDNYYYDLRLYETLSALQPLPVVSLKVGKNYGIVDKFIENPAYKTIVLARKNLKQQFLSFIVSTYTQTYHGNPTKIDKQRKQFDKIEIHPTMFVRWFDWLTRLHRIKFLAKNVFYIEDIEQDPNKFLNMLGLPPIDTFDTVIKKTQDTDFIKYIKNPDVFERTWNEYTKIYKGLT